MSAKAAQKFADTALQMFPTFRWDAEQEKVWSEHVMREIAVFDDNVIKRATTEMLRTRKPKGGKSPPTPTVAECIEYCSEAKRWSDAEQGKLPAVVSVADKPNDYGQGRADLGIKSPLGQQAAKEGWIGELHDHIAKHGRVPQAAEITTLKANAKDTDEFIRKALSRNGKTPGESVIARTAENMLNRRKVLADRAHGLERVDK